MLFYQLIWASSESANTGALQASFNLGSTGLVHQQFSGRGITALHAGFGNRRSRGSTWRPDQFSMQVKMFCIPAWHSSDCTSLLMTDSTTWVQIPQPVPSYFILELMVPYQQIREYLFKVNNNRRYMG